MSVLSRKSLCAALVAAPLCWAVSASANTFPYVETFEGHADPAAAGFTTSGFEWSIEPNAVFGSDALRNTGTATAAVSALALTQVTGVPTNYTASTQMVINSLPEVGPGGSAANFQTGLTLMAGSATDDTPSIRLSVNHQGWGGNIPGQMAISGRGTGPGGSNESFTTLFNDEEAPLLEGVIYTLTAQVSDNGTGGLNVDFTIAQDGGPSTMVSGSLTNAGVLGEFFGFRHRTAIFEVNPTHDVSFNNLSVVPEPASLGLLGLAGLMALRRRRLD